MTNEILVVEGLEQAVQEFNTWTGNARIYFDANENKVFAEVFANDVQAVGTFNVNDDVHCVWSKNERETNCNIGEQCKALLIKICGLIKDGWEMDEIKYNLAEDFYRLGL